MTLSSGIDAKAIYRPPSTLQLPGGVPGLDVNESAFSQPESMSSSSSQSSIGSSHGIQTDLAAEVVTVVPNPLHRSEVCRILIGHITFSNSQSTISMTTG